MKIAPNGQIVATYPFILILLKIQRKGSNLDISL